MPIQLITNAMIAMWGAILARDLLCISARLAETTLWEMEQWNLTI